jgi:hypothetical protein
MPAVRGRLSASGNLSHGSLTHTLPNFILFYGPLHWKTIRTADGQTTPPPFLSPQSLKIVSPHLPSNLQNCFPTPSVPPSEVAEAEDNGVPVGSEQRGIGPHLDWLRPGDRCEVWQPLRCNTCSRYSPFFAGTALSLQGQPFLCRDFWNSVYIYSVEEI